MSYSDPQIGGCTGIIQGNNPPREIRGETDSKGRFREKRMELSGGMLMVGPYTATGRLAIHGFSDVGIITYLSTMDQEFHA